MNAYSIVNGSLQPDNRLAQLLGAVNSTDLPAMRVDDVLYSTEVLRKREGFGDGDGDGDGNVEGKAEAEEDAANV